ncbi:MAG: EAL domain-containing protein [Trichodesmium sp. MAG_R04]|nr:EAL domain-containing protein [Trichodesmium sp. MAG_R04]
MMPNKEGKTEKLLQKEALIFEYLYDGVIITDIQGNIFAWNSGASRIFGYSQIDILGKTPAILHKPEIASKLTKQIIQKIKTHGRWTGEINFIRKDGSEGVSETTVTPIKNEYHQMVGTIGINRDITEQKRVQSLERYRMEKALQESEDRYQRLIDSSPEAIAVNYMEKLIYINCAAIRLFGANSQEEIIGHSLSQFIDFNYTARGKKQLQRVQQQEKLIKLNGEVIDVEIVKIPSNYNGKTATQIIIRDVTECKKIEAKLIYEKFHDMLTGLPNRILFLDRLKLALSRTQEHPNYQFALLFLDLDRFKVINDSLGYTIGDQLLVAISKILRNCIRASDILARLGGDEFIILLEYPTDIDYITTVATRINRELAKPIYLKEHEIFITASIGIVVSHRNFTMHAHENDSSFSPIYNNSEELLRDAEIAMYRAKALGKGRYEVFNLTIHNQAISLLSMEIDLRRAVEMIKENPLNSQFILNYQPIVCLSTGNIVGFEVLTRWQHPIQGLILPGKFIPLAEETGLIVPLEIWILQTAYYQLTIWQQELKGKYTECNDKFLYSSPNFRCPTDNFIMSINCSSQHFSQSNLLEEVNNILPQTNYQPNSLQLEITENIIIENISLATKILKKLKNKKIRLSIDDFGTGYSSLSYLQQLPINSVKIDRSFVSKLDSDTSGKTLKIVNTIITLAYNLGLEIIAEGIETKTQMQQLKRLKCNKGQGYLFSKPLESNDATKLLRNFKYPL